MVETKEVHKNEEMDREWLQLIMEAKNIGIKKEEIRRFLFREHEVLVEGR